MTAVVLFRKQFDSDGEMAAAREFMPVHGLRSGVPEGRLVVGRYACLPYYAELVADLAARGCRLVNSIEQHEYVANFGYYVDIAEHTFPTWFGFQDVPMAIRQAPFVLKGRTNSRKFQWNTHMYAQDFRRAMEMSSELMNDSLIGPQGLIIRQYVPLQRLETALNGMPITNEWRLFFYRDELLAHGYYWSILDDETLIDGVRPEFLAEGIPFAKRVAGMLAKRVNFFVLDIARTEAGEWKVVEVNDGQQSGLNHFVPAADLYRNLARVLADERI